MTIPTVTPYTGGIANPDGSQTQTEFTQNMFDQLSFEKTFVPELNNSITEINNAASQVDTDATNAAQSASEAQAAADSVATTQFVRSRIGNISDYAGDTLTESERFNIYQYPDNSEYWYGVKDGESFPVTIPADPSSDSKWAIVNVASEQWVAETVRNPNLLSNHNFLTPSPEDIAHPSATPTDYVAGTQIFSGVFVESDAVGFTYVNGRVKWTNPTGAIYLSVPNTSGLENVTEFVASVADFNGKPRTRGVTFSLIGDSYHVTVGIDALEDAGGNETLLGSVKFEQGRSATSHSVKDDYKPFASIEDYYVAGMVDHTSAFESALRSGKPVSMTSKFTYTIDASSIDLGNLSGVVVYGNKAKVRVKNSDLVIKSPTDTVFYDLSFEGDGDKKQKVWVSNYTNFYLVRCKFRKFSNDVLESDSTTLFMYAGDVPSAVAAAGDSRHGRLIDCDFDGERVSMFGVRIYTEFGSSQAAVNYDTVVLGGNYDQFMWNGVEVAGPNTISCGVDGHATAYNCGLSPFDLDKGAKNCFVRNVTIDKLTGLPAPWNAQTSPTVVNIAGYRTGGKVSGGCEVSNVTAKLYKADLDAVINRGSAIVSSDFATNFKFENIDVTLDGIPVSTPLGKMGLAMTALGAISGGRVKGVHSNIATHGVMELEQASSLVGSEKNFIDDISCDSTMSGESVGIASNSSDKMQYVISKLQMTTNLSATRFPQGTAINAISSNANSYVDISDSNILQFENFSVNAQIAKLGMRNTQIRNTSGGHEKFMSSANSLAWLNLSGITYNEDSLMVDTALASVSGSYEISSQKGYSEFDIFEKVNGSDLNVLSSSPVNPIISNWPIAQRLRKKNFTTSSGIDFIEFGGAWRSTGTLI